MRQLLKTQCTRLRHRRLRRIARWYSHYYTRLRLRPQQQ
jgi:hypothetical protein